MPVIDDGSQSYMSKRALNTLLQLYLFHALSLKKRADKPYQYQLFKDFSVKHLSKTYSWLPTTLTKANQIKYIHLPKTSLD